MKNYFKLFFNHLEFRCNFIVLLLLVFGLFLTKLNAQEKLNLKANSELNLNLKSIIEFDKQELKNRFLKLQKNKKHNILLIDAQNKGYLKVPGAEWGYSAKTSDGESFEIQIYDMAKKDDHLSAGSIVYRKFGKEEYFAYIEFPKDAKGNDERFDLGTEYYIDKDSKVKLANSWGKCFRKCVKRDVNASGVETEINNGKKSKVKIGQRTITVSCAGNCINAALNCGIMVGGLGVVATGVLVGLAATGVGAIATPEVAVATVAIGLAAYVFCVGASCGPCIAVCAIGCVN